MGYKNVYVYDEGLPIWVKNGYPTESEIKYPKTDAPFVSGEDLKKMIETQENIFIVDLRDQVDRKSGWIKNSVNIPLIDIQDRHQEIPKDTKVVLLDVYGKQTYTAARYLASKKHKSLYRLEGGFLNGWIKANYPVER
jgi:rhodanese-related sulfurtransferase